MVLCDGGHDLSEVGFHIRCLTPPLDHLPAGDWLCPLCKSQGLDLISEVIDKRTRKGKVQYAVKWKLGGDETWEFLANIPPGARSLVTAYNARFRASST